MTDSEPEQERMDYYMAPAPDPGDRPGEVRDYQGYALRKYYEDKGKNK